jgi:hypothetical protein
MAYFPTQCPAIDSVDELRKWVQDEFTRLSQSLQTVDSVTYIVTYVAPAGPVAGMTVFADGTSWNPGSGRGLYEYRVNSWVKL